MKKLLSYITFLVAILTPIPVIFFVEDPALDSTLVLIQCTCLGAYVLLNLTD